MQASTPLLHPLEPSFAVANWRQRSSFIIQIVATVLAQMLNRAYYAQEFPDSLREIGFLDDATEKDPDWLFFTTVAILVRIWVVYFSRFKAVLESTFADSKLDRATIEYVVATIVPNLRTREAQISDRGAAEAAEKITGRLAPSFTDSRAPDVLSMHSSLLKWSRGIIALDSSFSIPSDMFFAISCYQLFLGKNAPWWIFTIGVLLGINDARSNFDFRGPSMECSVVVLAEIWRNRKSTELNISWREFKKTLYWSVYVGVTRGVFTYFSAAQMMQDFMDWFADKTDWNKDSCDSLGSAIAVLMASTCVITNFNNRFYLGRYMTGESTGEKKTLTIMQTCAGKAAVNATWGACYVSTACDYALAVMTYLYILQLIPGTENKPGFWSLFLLAVLGSMPITKYNLDFTGWSAVSAVMSLFKQKEIKTLSASVSDNCGAPASPAGL